MFPEFKGAPTPIFFVGYRSNRNVKAVVESKVFYPKIWSDDFWGNFKSSQKFVWKGEVTKKRLPKRFESLPYVPQLAKQKMS